MPLRRTAPLAFPRHVEEIGSPTNDHNQVDRALIARFVRGDEAALAVILRVYWTSIVTYAAVYVGSEDAAQDIAQEAFARLWRHRKQWIADQPVRPFLYRVAHNLAHNEQRHRQVRTHWETAARVGPPVTSPSVAQLYDADVLHDEIQRAIQALPERRRQVFILARFDGLSHREIAEMMGISVQTVANQMSTALTELRTALAPFTERPIDNVKVSPLRHG